MAKILHDESRGKEKANQLPLPVSSHPANTYIIYGTVPGFPPPQTTELNFCLETTKVLLLGSVDQGTDGYHRLYRQKGQMQGRYLGTVHTWKPGPPQHSEKRFLHLSHQLVLICSEPLRGLSLSFF